MNGRKYVTQIAGWLWVVLVIVSCRASPPTPAPVSSLPSPTRPVAARPSPTPLAESASYWPTKTWRTSTPEQQGLDSARLVEVLDHIQERDYPVHGIAIVRNGYLVMEAYVHPFRAEDRHHIASCTKSFVSALIGIALEQGYIDSLDQKLLDFFPDRTVANRDRQKEAITLEHLLTMSSGLAWPGRGLSESLQPQMSQSQDWVQFVLDRPMGQEPGTGFRYNSGGSHLLAAIVWQTTGRTPLEFARESLFKQLGITNVYWPADPTGLNFGGGGLELRLPDLAKFGYLYLQQGIWEGQAVLPSAWVATSTTAQIETGYMDYDYGYQWWVDSAGLYHARGFGGQYIFVVPEQNMVVVFVSGFTGPDMETVPDALLKSFIIPAATSTIALPANPEQTARLEARLHSLAQPEPNPVAPLPPMAKNISGQTYRLEANAMDIRAFTFHYSENPAREAWLEAELDSGPVEWTVGLDDVYRFTGSAEAIGYRLGTIAMKGSWTNDKAFKLDYMLQGNTGNLRFIFEETGVMVHFESPWEAETVAGNVQE
jgi:CubicO group peptidase (beta-lactamase class C family)